MVRIITEPPDNTFSLYCIVRLTPTTVILNHTVEWRDVTDGADIVIDSSSQMYTIASPADVDSVSSVLTGDESTAGIRQFSCVASVSPPRDPTITRSASAANVVVDGELICCCNQHNHCHIY